jgi:hypothetical protein
VPVGNEGRVDADEVAAAAVGDTDGVTAGRPCHVEGASHREAVQRTVYRQQAELECGAVQRTEPPVGKPELEGDPAPVTVRVERERVKQREVERCRPELARPGGGGRRRRLRLALGSGWGSRSGPSRSLGGGRRGDLRCVRGRGGLPAVLQDELCGFVARQVTGHPGNHLDRAHAVLRQLDPALVRFTVGVDEANPRLVRALDANVEARRRRGRQHDPGGELALEREAKRLRVEIAAGRRPALQRQRAQHRPRRGRRAGRRNGVCAQRRCQHQRQQENAFHGSTWKWQV